MLGMITLGRGGEVIVGGGIIVNHRLDIGWMRGNGGTRMKRRFMLGALLGRGKQKGKETTRGREKGDIEGEVIEMVLVRVEVGVEGRREGRRRRIWDLEILPNRWLPRLIQHTLKYNKG